MRPCEAASRPARRARSRLIPPTHQCGESRSRPCARTAAEAAPGPQETTRSPRAARRLTHELGRSHQDWLYLRRNAVQFLVGERTRGVWSRALREARAARSLSNPCFFSTLSSSSTRSTSMFTHASWSGEESDSELIACQENHKHHSDQALSALMKPEAINIPWWPFPSTDRAVWPIRWPACFDLQRTISDQAIYSGEQQQKNLGD